MNHQSKIAFFKAKFKFWDFFHTLTAILLSLIFLAGLFFLADGNEAGFNLCLFLFVVDLICLIILTKITNNISNAADDYCSEHMLKPILSEMFQITSFEPKGKTKNFLRDKYIFPSSDYLLTRSRFKADCQGTKIEGFDFASLSYGNWGVKIYESKGHCGIVKLSTPFSGKMILMPKTLQYKGERILGSFFRKDNLQAFPTNLSDFPYDISTNNPSATAELLTEDALLTIKNYPLKRRRIIYLEVDGEYAYVFLKDNYWYNQVRANGEIKGKAKLINSNGIWGAEDAEEIEHRMKTDWAEMKSLIDIFSKQ